MDKANVMKALALCGTRSETCTGCPYYGMEGCDRHMCDDAVSLLKANDNPTYHTALIYTKRDNLDKWFDVNGYQFMSDSNMEYSERYQRMREYYAREREIQLILLVRREEGKYICRIKCPINPLPIKGEFQCVSISQMTNLLTSLGWTYKEKLNYSLLFT
jgi:hypothetical protein